MSTVETLNKFTINQKHIQSLLAYIKTSDICQMTLRRFEIWSMENRLVKRETKLDLYNSGGAYRDRKTRSLSKLAVMLWTDQTDNTKQ